MKKQCFVVLFAALSLAVVVSGCTNGSDSTGTQPPVTDSETLTVTRVEQPIEVVSVRSVQDASGLVNPAGPAVEITLKNISGESITALDVTMDEGAHRVYDFGFGVTRGSPLLSGHSISAEMILIGGGFGGEPPYGSMSYLLTINGTMENGNIFGFTWESPGYMPAVTEGTGS